MDAVVAATYAEFDAFPERLRQRGFRDDSAVICRYRHPAGVVLDVMPIDAEVLGFGNRWYAEGVVTAGTLTLPSGAWIRALRPPWLVATKLEAIARQGDCPGVLRETIPEVDHVFTGLDGPLIDAVVPWLDGCV